MFEYGEEEPFPPPVLLDLTASNFRVRYVYSNEREAVEEVITMESGMKHKFELVGKISQTIFGEVVLGIGINSTGDMAGSEEIYSRSNFHVAIKMYYQHLMTLPQRGLTQENPYNEIGCLQFVAEANSPNIVGQIECDVDHDRDIYSIMSFFPGVELLSHINNHGRFSENQAREMMRQLVSALQVLQNRGIAHRDLSLENILFDPERELFSIIDFGMCVRCPRTAQSLLRPPEVLDPSCFCPIRRRPPCGKRHYISPEVLSGGGEGYDEQYFNPLLSDLWALGIIFFMVLTGHPLVELASPVSERFRMIAEDRLSEMVEGWGCDFSDEALDLLQRLLRVQPFQRIVLREILEHPFMRL